MLCSNEKGKKRILDGILCTYCDHCFERNNPRKKKKLPDNRDTLLFKGFADLQLHYLEQIEYHPVNKSTNYQLYNIYLYEGDFRGDMPNYDNPFNIFYPNT